MIRKAIQPAIRPAFRSPFAAPYSGLQILSVPAGFGWTPPVTVFRASDGTYSTDYDPTPFLREGDPGVTTYYVDGQTGNDANPGTSAAPKRSLVPISAGRQSKLLIKARGTFYAGTTGDIQMGHDELCVEAWDGAACTITTLGDPVFPTTLTWTDEGSGVWSAPPSFAGFNGISVYSGTDIDALTKYPLAASLAACQATPGTHFRETSPSIKHYVHTLDGTSPATGHFIFGAVSRAQDWNVASFAYPQRAAFHGVTFLGGLAAFEVFGTSVHSKRLDLVDCRFAHGSTSGAMQARGTVEVILQECIAGPSDFDGFSYHTPTGGSTGDVPDVVEIGCTGRDCGVSTGANQGSTTHFGGRILRVNGTYQNNQHDQVADVGANTRAWNLGCTFGPRRTGDTTNSGITSGNDASDCQTWLDGCTFNDVAYDVTVASGATLRYRNMTAPSENPSGSGTVETY